MASSAWMGGAKRKLTRKKVELRAREKLGLFKKKKMVKRKYYPKKREERNRERQELRDRERSLGVQRGAPYR